jgi:hypothetical protein
MSTTSAPRALWIRSLWPAWCFMLHRLVGVMCVRVCVCVCFHKARSRAKAREEAGKQDAHRRYARKMLPVSIMTPTRRECARTQQKLESRHLSKWQSCVKIIFGFATPCHLLACVYVAERRDKRNGRNTSLKW